MSQEQERARLGSIYPGGTTGGSSLAGHAARCALQLDECGRGLVAGVNLDAPGIEDSLDQLAEIVDGKPFAIVGLTKYDWTDEGRS